MTSIIYKAEFSVSQLPLNPHYQFLWPPQSHHTFLLIFAHRSHHSSKPPDISNFLYLEFSSFNTYPLTSDLILYYSLHGRLLYLTPHYWSIILQYSLTVTHKPESKKIWFNSGKRPVQNSTQWQIECGGLNKNVLHGLMSGWWFPVGDIVPEDWEAANSGEEAPQ